MKNCWKVRSMTGIQRCIFITNSCLWILPFLCTVKRLLFFARRDTGAPSKITGAITWDGDSSHGTCCQVGLKSHWQLSSDSSGFLSWGKKIARVLWQLWDQQVSFTFLWTVAYFFACMGNECILEWCKCHATAMLYVVEHRSTTHLAAFCYLL